MNTPNQNPTPYGLFRYLYNHYLVRYPNYNLILNTALTDDLWKMVDQIDADNIEAHLATDGWLIGMACPNLTESVRALWPSIPPSARGDYLAGFTEYTYLAGQKNAEQLSFIRNQLSKATSLEFTSENACQIGCCLLALGRVEITGHP